MRKSKVYCLAGIITGILFLSCFRLNKTQDENWIHLFNGKDLNDWNIKIQGHPLNDNYKNTFKVEEGLLKVNYDGYDSWNNRYGHIFYEKKYSSYLLSVEYRFTGKQIKNGPDWAYRNSGIMLHSQDPESMKIDQNFPISLEMQFLGGKNVGERTTGNLCTPGTHVIFNGSLYTPHCLNSTSNTYKGNDWVNAEVLVLNDSIIKHIVEKDTVLVYEKPVIDSSDNLYDPKLYGAQQFLGEGYIALQSESHPVEFRKIAIYDLSRYAGNPKKLRGILDKLRNRERK